MADQTLSTGRRLTERKLNLTCYISHASDGTLYATRLGKTLQGLGARILLADSNKISAGSRLVDSLRNYIDSANVLILVASPMAITSRWIANELTFFNRRTGRTIPITFTGLTSSGGDIFPLQLLLHEVPFLLRDSILRLRKGPSQQMLLRLVESLEQIQSNLPPVHLKPTLSRSQTESRPLNECKLILVGRGEVGKTSLVKRLVENNFDGNESKTQGIKITTWFVPCHTGNLRLNIWDFGGQEIMHATHQFFLTEQSLYLLVLNGREGGEDIDAEYWLKHIESFGGDSPVIVVQNKIAQHPFELNYRGLISRYPQIRGFVKTDCKDRMGLTDLRKLVESVISDMPEVQMQFPADWFAVKERLESMGDEYLGYQRFVELCIQEGIDDEADRDKLAFVMHCLGIALNYRDDFRLRETSVLKPEWVTHGIYSILNAKKLAERQGELQLGDLEDLLPRNRYPFDKHLFLLELMRKFSLCFSFQDDENRYLVPELLGKEEPEDVATFQPEDCLNFEYHYGILPEGLLPRFIVRTHTLSRGQQRWRSGVVLSYEDCNALVKAETVDRRVVVRVRGSDANARRNLLAIIRYDLDRIHAEFKDRLDAQPKVPLAEFPTFSVDYRKLLAFERQGVKEYPEFVGDKIATVHVNELLNGVDFDAQRGNSLDALNSAKSLFFSYSHKDAALRDELETHLKLLQRQGIISTWHDRKILPGNEWDLEIDNRLERASIVLLLISADFIASDYCWDKEVKHALERHARGDAAVVPVLLRSCDWKGAPFGKLQGLPTGMIAVTAWSDRDAAWTDVAGGIRTIAERLPRNKLVG